MQKGSPKLYRSIFLNASALYCFYRDHTELLRPSNPSLGSRKIDDEHIEVRQLPVDFVCDMEMVLKVTVQSPLAREMVVRLICQEEPQLIPQILQERIGQELFCRDMEEVYKNLFFQAKRAQRRAQARDRVSVAIFEQAENYGTYHVADQALGVFNSEEREIQTLMISEFAGSADQESDATL